MALIVAGCAAPPACYHGVSEGQGWKRVALPRAAPHLAAPVGIDQFRSNAPVDLWGDWQRAEEWGHHLGQTRYRLVPPEFNETVEVQFGARLGGAAVEVVGTRGAQSFVVFPRQRTHADSLRLPMEAGIDELMVIVHHHLRAAPEVSWRSGSQATLAVDWLEGWPLGGQKGQAPARGELTYFDPGEGGLELCEAPSQRLGLRTSRGRGVAVVASLRPTPLTRLLHGE